MEQKGQKQIERKFLTLKQAADYLGLKPATLYSHTHKRVLPFYKVRSRRIYFLKSDLDEFILNDTNLVKSNDQIELEAIESLIKEEI